MPSLLRTALTTLRHGWPGVLLLGAGAAAWPNWGSGPFHVAALLAAGVLAWASLQGLPDTGGLGLALAVMAGAWWLVGEALVLAVGGLPLAGWPLAGARVVAFLLAPAPMLVGLWARQRWLAGRRADRRGDSDA